VCLEKRNSDDLKLEELSRLILCPSRGGARFSRSAGGDSVVLIGNKPRADYPASQIGSAGRGVPVFKLSCDSFIVTRNTDRRLVYKNLPDPLLH
jgi:hypothetical protein